MRNSNKNLSKQEQEQFQILMQEKVSKQTTLFNIARLDQQTNKINATLTLSLKYFLPFLFFLNILPRNSEHFALLLSQFTIEYSIIFYALLIIFKCIIIVILIALNKQLGGSSQIAVETLKLLKGKLRALIELDYYLSMSLSALFLSAMSIIICTISLLIYMFACIYLQNYINKEDIFYCSSCKLNFVFRIITLIGYLTAILMRIQANKITINTLLANYTILIAIWFYRSGYQIYPNNTIKLDAIVFISLLLTSFVLKIEIDLAGGSTNLSQFITRIILAFTIICFCNYKIVQDKINHITNEHPKIKQLVNYLSISDRKNIFIQGRIQMHKRQCSNMRCQLQLIHIEDQRNPLQEEAILKSFFRSIYQTKIEKQEEQNSDLLQYCEYLYSEHNANPFKMSLIFQRITPQKLSIFDKCCYYNLKKSIESMFKNQMSYLYEGKLSFQQLLSYQHSYSIIEQNIHNLTVSNIQVYQQLSSNQIDFNSIFKRIKQHQAMQTQLNHQWLKIGKKLTNKKLFTAIYFFYRQLIKNQMIPRKDFTQANLQEQQECYFQQLPIETLDQKFFNPCIVYHKETMVFTACLNHQQLIFKNMSLNFIHLLKFSKQQLLSESINLVLPDHLKQVHEQSFSLWLNQNIKPSYFEANYQIKNSQCLTKDNKTLHVIKYFKCYVDCKSSLQFVCMLKYNNKNKASTQQNRFQKNKADEQSNKSKLFSLSSQNQSQYAIFIKDKQFQPTPKLQNIFIIKIIIFVFLIFNIIGLVSFHLITVSKSATLQDYSEQYITFMQCYRIPMILGNNYLSSFLNIGNKTKIATQIVSLRERFIALQSSKAVIKTLYDKAINTASSYLPYKNSPLNNSFDQIQIFYLISKSISSLNAPVNKDSLDFQIFDQYITPAYDQMLNNTKRKFHQSFVTFINQIKQLQLAIFILQVCLSALFMLLIILQLNGFNNKMDSIGIAIANCSQEDIYTIQRYWIKSKMVFQHLFYQFRQQVPPQGHLQIDELAQVKNPFQGEYLNRVVKNIKQSQDNKKGIRISFIKLFAGATILIICLTLTEFSIGDKLNYLIYFQNEGYLFLRSFPTATIVGYGCLSKYYNLKYPQELAFNPNRFDTVLGAMKLVGQFPFIAEVKEANSQYFLKQKNYFFGNPCRYNPNVIESIGISVQKCQTIINSSFSGGLRNYMSIGYELANYYIFGRSNLNADQLNQFSISVTILSAYILDAITTWGLEFNNNLENLIQRQNIFTIINSITLVLTIVVVFQFMLVSFLQKQYQFYRYLFMKMIPSYILKKDKVLRQSFINSKILQ